MTNINFYFSLLLKSVHITALNKGNSSNMKLSQLEWTLIAHFLTREKKSNLNLSCNTNIMPIRDKIKEVTSN